MNTRTKKLPPLRVGIGGPVGSGKTTLLEMLCKAMRAHTPYVRCSVKSAKGLREVNDFITERGLLPPMPAQA